MVAVPALLADQLHVSAGSAERAGEASLEAALVAGSVIKLSSALATCLYPPPAPSGANCSFSLFITLSSLSQCESVSIIILTCLSLGELQVPALDSQMGLTHPSLPSIALSSRYSLCNLE